MSELNNIKAALQQAADYVQATWQQVVMGTEQVPGAKPINLNIGLRRLYADSIITGKQIAGMSNVSQRIVAAKKIAEQLEWGTGPWDMKPMLLGGPKSRVGKNGKYNIIPFRHGTSDKYSPNSNFTPMPKNVYKQARELKATIAETKRVANPLYAHSTQGTHSDKHIRTLQWGGRLAAQGPAGQNKTSGYQHKNDKYEGMVRVEKTYAKATQSQYMTFRVVSERSAAGSWIHPGYEAHNIAQGVAAFCKSAVEQMIGDAAAADIQQAIVSRGLG